MAGSASRLASLSHGDPFDWLDAVARHAPERELIETPDGKRLTYREMVELTCRIAGALARRNVEPGDRVCAQIDKSPEGVALYLAGHAGFRRTLLEEPWSSRLLWAALAALATVPLGLHGTAAIQLSALVLVLIVTVRRGSSTSPA